MLFRVEVLQKGWKSAGFLTVTVGILKYFQVFIWIQVSCLELKYVVYWTGTLLFSNEKIKAKKPQQGQTKKRKNTQTSVSA